jgi:hypothetical protein
LPYALGSYVTAGIAVGDDGRHWARGVFTDHRPDFAKTAAYLVTIFIAKCFFQHAQFSLRQDKAKQLRRANRIIVEKLTEILASYSRSNQL